jgi:hypothetical protein
MVPVSWVVGASRDRVDPCERGSLVRSRRHRDAIPSHCANCPRSSQALAAVALPLLKCYRDKGVASADMLPDRSRSTIKLLGEGGQWNDGNNDPRIAFGVREKPSEAVSFCDNQAEANDPERVHRGERVSPKTLPGAYSMRLTNRGRRQIGIDALCTMTRLERH